MASKIRPKMSIENRAKQFMPFAALKGLPEALEEKERLWEEEMKQKSIPIEDGMDIEIIEN